MSTFPTELAAETDTQNIRSQKKKHEKGPYSRDKKIAIICKACGKEMPNGTEIMSMFPTESAVELDTQNIRSPKKTPKGTLFQRQKDPYHLQSMWEGNAKWY